MMQATLVLDYFRHIAQIPRPSKQEDRMRDRLIDRADSHGYRHQTDIVGNFVVYIPATQDDTDKPVVILQAHMDMVTVKGAASEHNFDTDPIQIVEEDGRWYGKDTTLGADNGIGMAMLLAAAQLPSHPPLELLFTVDEEQGMSGVNNLDASMLSGHYIINLDTEEFPELCISSAGGARIYMTQTPGATDTSPDQQTYQLTISGLRGGHSGVDITKRRGNAILACCEIIASYDQPLALHELTGGEAMNAIPHRAQATISCTDNAAFEHHVQQYLAQYQQQYDCPEISYALTAQPTPTEAITAAQQLCAQLASFQRGVHAMSTAIAGLVQTSLNLGYVSLTPDQYQADIMPRSSVDADVQYLYQLLQKHFTDRSVDLQEPFQGRAQDPNDQLVLRTQQAFEQTIEQKPKILAYHAGLECGALVAACGPQAQAVSFGPTILDAHSPSERVHLESIDQCRAVLQTLLQIIH